jgi:hypothetical protein
MVDEYFHLTAKQSPRRTDCLEVDPAEATLGGTELANEDINHATRIALVDPMICRSSGSSSPRPKTILGEIGRRKPAGCVPSWSAAAKCDESTSGTARARRAAAQSSLPRQRRTTGSSNANSLSCVSGSMIRWSLAQLPPRRITSSCRALRCTKRPRRGRGGLQRSRHAGGRWYRSIRL